MVKLSIKITQPRSKHKKAANLKYRESAFKMAKKENQDYQTLFSKQSRAIYALGLMYEKGQ